MSSHNEQVRTFEAAAALSAYSRVTIDANGKAALATSDNLDVGILQRDVAAGDAAPVRLYHPTFPMKAAGAITAGSQVYPATSGRISGSATGGDIGIAVEAATAAGDVIEIAPILQ